MSRQLVESIIDKEFVLAESHLTDRLNAIMEKKLYEKKRMVSAEMNEVLGGMTRAEIEAKKKAGYRKAADVLQDPRDIKIKISSMGRKKSTKKKAVEEEILDELTVGDVAHRLKRTHRLVRMKRHQAQSQKSTGDQDLRKSDLKRDVLMGVKRTKTRLNVLRTVPGAMKDIAVDSAKRAGEKLKTSIGKTVSDPGPAIASAASQVASAPKKIIKTARTQGTKTNTALRYIAGALKSV